MADLNKVFLMGRLTFDPELRRTAGGIAVSDLRLATSRSWTGKDGERKEETLFIDVQVWDRQAENCCQYLRKGSGVHVEGSLKMDTWDDKTTGEKRTKIKVHADRVQFLDRRDDSSLVRPVADRRRRGDPGPPPRRQRHGPRRLSAGPGPGGPPRRSRRPQTDPDGETRISRSDPQPTPTRSVLFTFHPALRFAGPKSEKRRVRGEIE